MAEVKSLFLSLIRRSLFNLLFLLIFFGECMNIYWGALLIAGLFEIGWPLGLKITALPGMKLWGILLAIVSMALSGALLWFSLRGIPIGTA